METVSLVEKSAYYWEEEPRIEKKYFDSNSGKYKMVDLCCGAGGLSKGFEMTGKIEIVLGVDIHTSAMDTFKANHPNSSTILGDVRKIPDEMFKEVLGDMKINIVAAGVPCQGFSLSNKKRTKEDERNFLFLEVIRFVNLVKPDVVLIENVSGMQSLDNGAFVKQIELALASAGDGYKVKSELLNAADFGVPQIRKRLFFVAIRNKLSLPDFKFPISTHGKGREYNYVTIKEAISDLPMIESGEQAKEYDRDPESQFQKMMRINSKGLFNHVAPKHPQATIEKIRATKPGEPMYERYRQRIRLAWDILSPTQLAGGIRPQFQFGHPEKARGLTIRERARIQSFPDDYIFYGGTVQGRVQTGNAVPPLLARAIAIQIIKTLEQYKPESEKSSMITI